MCRPSSEADRGDTSRSGWAAGINGKGAITMLASVSPAFAAAELEYRHQQIDAAYDKRPRSVRRGNRRVSMLRRHRPNPVPAQVLLPH
jgi:hypothetical protein